MTAAEAGPIEVDSRAGRVSGASTAERLGLMAMRAAASAAKPFDYAGFSLAARLIAGVLPSARAVRLRLADDAVFEMPYGDAYWGVLMPFGAWYEDDVHSVMLALADTDYAFVDCGANYGYWSVLVSSRMFGAHAAAAVEAAPDTFVWLSRNARANADRFAALNRAVAARSGDTVAVYGGKHEARSIVGGNGAPSVGSVETLALDDLLSSPQLATAARIVLKLDVEGVEVAALGGAGAMLARDVLILYEDHGADRTHAISAHLMGEMGMTVFVAGPYGARRVADVAEVGRIKTNRRRGYNFFATRASFWLDAMEQVVSGAPAAEGAPSPRAELVA